VTGVQTCALPISTMTGTLSAYLTRLDGDGVPVWVSECEGVFNGRTLTASPSGIVYVVAHEGMTLFKGEAGELNIPKELDDDDTMRMYAVIRIDPAGAPVWVRRIILPEASTLSLVAGDDDSVVVAVRTGGEIQIRDDQGVAAALTTTSPNVVAASIAADGAVEWLMETGLITGARLVHTGGDVWISGTLPGEADAIKLGDQVLPLPPLDFDPTFDLRAMIRVAPGGVAIEARINGAGLWVSHMSTDGVNMLL